MELSKIEKVRRIKMMMTGALLIFFTGFPHVWSVYQPYVMEQAGWSQSQASMCFYLYFATFVFGNIVGGKIQDRYNPRIVVRVGGGIFAVGVLCSAFSVLATPVPMYLTYGILQGFGQGMVYITILSTAQKWFPERTGFASGIIVTANGLCGLIMAPVSRTLLAGKGLRFTFLAVGTAIAVAWILSSIFFVLPEKKQKDAEESGAVKKKQYTSGEMIKTKSFYCLLAAMMFGLMSYFLVSPVSQTYQIGIGIPEMIAVSTVMIGAVANAGARLLLPALADKVGRSICVKAILVVSMAAMCVLGLSHSYMVAIAVVLTYGCYGGIMGSFPAFTSSVFGMKHSGANYGLVMLGMAVASFGAPAVSNVILNWGGSMQTVFAAGIVFAALSFICLMMLDRELKLQNMGGINYGVSNNENITGTCTK